MSKDEWVLAAEQLHEELGRKPTSKEVEERCIENFSNEIDAAEYQMEDR